MTVRPIDAVNVLNDISWHHKPTPVSEFESGFNQGINQAMWIITHAPTITPPNEWVSVDERLPEPGERVLASNGSFVGEAYMASNGTWMRHDGFPWEVDAWMPMPDRRPPEGKENTCE